MADSDSSDNETPEQEGDDVVERCCAISYSDGSRYEGQWQGKEKHGFGVMTFADNSVYLGKFQRGLADGYGLQTFVGGGRYIGTFSKGLYHGYGLFSRADGASFEGQFANGKINGFGTLTYPNGDRDEGEWERTSLKRSCDSSAAVLAARAVASAARAYIGTFTTPLRVDV
eukprot:m.49803 g.49803  ORF g.49803 m.49803 type:complete len:171 (-) comp17952_c0_seq4:300-812(-)